MAADRRFPEEVKIMKQAKYATRMEPIVFSGKGFCVTCSDVVIQNRVVDYIAEKGGSLTRNKPDYVIYSPGADYPLEFGNCVMLTYIQFWMAAGELDRIQQHEWVEASLAYLGSDSPFNREQEEKILWYIRDNRDKILSAMLEQSAMEPIGGYLRRSRRVLPEAFAKITESGDYEQQILLDLVDELIEKASALEKHEVKAFLLEYKRTHLPGEFVEEVQQADLEKELGFRDRNEYDWLKLFDFKTEENGIHIFGYKGADELVFIPDEIAGKPVAAIHVRNFYADKRGLQFYWQRPAFLGVTADMDALRASQVGDTVLFGRYPQTKTSDMEPLRWQVLKKENGRLLVISCLCLDKVPYHLDFEKTDWENCHLRRWLNGPFYQLSFTPEEQAMIPEVITVTATNEKYGTPGGSDTPDRVFALSSAEAAELFPSDESRIGRTTAYHQVQGYYFGGKFNCWWLRTPGVDHEFVTLIGNSGSVGTYGYRVDNNEYAVRPAMWIEIGG